MNKKSLFLLLLASLFTFTAWAQGHKNLRITEVMVQDTAGIAGDKANGWIELYNSSYGTYAIEKMFITNQDSAQIFSPANKKAAKKTNKTDKNDAVLRHLSSVEGSNVYMIPRGDESNTSVSPHSQVVFIADGHPEKGTYHLPFTLDPGKANYIAVYDVNGDLVDTVTVPANLPAGYSYALKAEGRLPIEGQMPASCYEQRDGKTVATAITPGNFNTREANENIEKFHNGDPYGIIITLIAMLIVFIALALLFLLFKLFGVVSSSLTKEAPAAKGAQVAQPVVKEAPTADAGDEEIAAICMALYQHFNSHDEESGVITIKHTPTAWNSESQLLRPTPKQNF